MLLIRGGKPSCQPGEGADVLGDLAYAESSCPGFQAHEQVHHTAHQHGHCTGCGRIDAHGASCQLCEEPLGEKGALFVGVVLDAQQILAVETYVGAVFLLCPHKSEIAEQAVRQCVGTGVNGKVAVCLVGEQRSDIDGEQQTPDDKCKEQGAVQKGQPSGRLRHLTGKQGHGQEMPPNRVNSAESHSCIRPKARNMPQPPPF